MSIAYHFWELRAQTFKVKATHLAEIYEMKMTSFVDFALLVVVFYFATIARRRESASDIKKGQKASEILRFDINMLPLDSHFTFSHDSSRNLIMFTPRRLPTPLAETITFALPFLCN